MNSGRKFLPKQNCHVRHTSGSTSRLFVASRRIPEIAETTKRLPKIAEVRDSKSTAVKRIASAQNVPNYPQLVAKAK